MVRMTQWVGHRVLKCLVRVWIPEFAYHRIKMAKMEFAVAFIFTQSFLERCWLDCHYQGLLKFLKILKIRFRKNLVLRILLQILNKMIMKRVAKVIDRFDTCGKPLKTRLRQYFHFFKSGGNW